MDQIQRNGVWWTPDMTGGWLRYDPLTSQWEPSASPPPPPAPPPPGYVAPVGDLSAAASGEFAYDPSIYVPLPKKSRAEEFRALMTRLDPRVAIAGALVVALVLLGGLGWAVLGGGDPEPVAAAGVSLGAGQKLTPKQKFIRAADGLCADLMTQMRRLPIPTDLSEAAAVMKKIRRIVARTIERGQAIKAPKKARAGWKRFVGTREDLKVFDEVMNAMLRGDVATAQRMETELNEQAAKHRRWAKRYGLKVCSQEF